MFSGMQENLDKMATCKPQTFRVGCMQILYRVHCRGSTEVVVLSTVDLSFLAGGADDH